MRNLHKDLIRDEMHKSDKYCHDICNLSISDIFALITYNYQCIDKSKFPIDSAMHSTRMQIIAELEEYLFEFNGRLSNRTVDFQIPKQRK